MPHVTCQHRGCSFAASQTICTAPQNTKIIQHGTDDVLIGFAHQGEEGRHRVHAVIDHPQLANGLSMPTIHLGVYLTSGKETYQAVRWALEVDFFLFLA